MCRRMQRRCKEQFRVIPTTWVQASQMLQPVKILLRKTPILAPASLPLGTLKEVYPLVPENLRSTLSHDRNPALQPSLSLSVGLAFVENHFCMSKCCQDSCTFSRTWTSCTGPSSIHYARALKRLPAVVIINRPLDFSNPSPIEVSS